MTLYVCSKTVQLSERIIPICTFLRFIYGVDRLSTTDEIKDIEGNYFHRICISKTSVDPFYSFSL